MPSPPIQRPDISEKQQSLSIIQSDQSSRSSTSAKGNTWSKKAANLIPRKKYSELTEASLEEFNRRNAILEEKRYSTSSPYYNGLTHSTPDINEEKVPVIEIHETASVTSSTRSSFVVKMQQMGTFSFIFKNKKKKKGGTYSFPSLSSSTQKARDSEKDGKEIKSSLTESKNTQLLNKDKPLRERVLSTHHAPPPPPPPPRSMLPLQELQPAQTSKTKKEVTLSVIELDENEVKRKLFTWADKYRPCALTDFICNRDIAFELQATAQSEDCHHFILQGPPGVGKRTMIWALLREAFGADKVQAREEYKEFGLKGEAVSSIHVNVKQSSQHVEVNLSELKGYENHVIVQLIKDKNNKLSTTVYPCTPANCKAIILYEADKLSTDALLYIRWLLERYKGCNKVLFCCNDASKLEPIQSLCKVVNLLPPSNKEIVDVLEFIANQEGIELPHQLAEKITGNSKNNLRQAIRSFEATWRSNKCSSQLKEDQMIMTGWEDAIAKIAEDIVKEQSPKQLFNTRGQLQKLFDHNVSPAFIFKTLVEELKKLLDESLHINMDKLYKEYNREDDSDDHFAFPRNRTEEMNKRLNDPVRNNVQHFMRIEEFIAKFMSCYTRVWLQI